MRRLDANRRLVVRDTFSEFMNAAQMGEIGVAVSGGGDSVALLVLVVEWAKKNGRRVFAATVDHGLRSESAQEALFVAALCAQHGVEHSVLNWEGDKDRGNLQDAARQARHELLGQWAIAKGLCGVATGHTRDDQAETFLQRLKRGSGVDGLSAMRPTVHKNGLLWLRPLLEVRRQELRVFLEERDVGWIEDPSNEDERYDRVKFRNALKQLEEIGLGVDCLADTAQRMTRAREGLENGTLDLARRCAAPREIGTVRIDLLEYSKAVPEIQLRLLAHALGWVSSAKYRPRLRALEVANNAMIMGKQHTLSGCILAPFSVDVAEIVREPKAVKWSDENDTIFDKRWAVSIAQGIWRTLGHDGIANCPNWRDLAESRIALLASPSLWYNNELKSAPFADRDSAYKCSLVQGTDSFFGSIVTH